ncbi:MAG: sugar transferase [Bacteroidia bacterium]|nr:sugar transferase [Bacteroidia bacterium]
MDSANSLFYRIIKIAGDYIFAAVFLVAVSPLSILLSIIVYLTSGWPVIYSQKRTGLNGQSFYIYKFRSLKHGLSEGINLISDTNDPRITKIGRIIRKYRIDEIPNFINVLKGEMSVVGPRPEQGFYIDKIVQIEPAYNDILKIKPGVTSWGEVKYGYASTVEQMIERLKYDLYYLEHRSLLFDLRIILHTIRIVLMGRGI